MPLFMDIHRNVEGLTAEAVEAAHLRDLELQRKHHVTMLKYWYDVETRTAFCLMVGPNKEACSALHREGHGLVADEIFEVAEGKEPELHLNDETSPSV
jgi:hypothetical protein